MDPLLERIYAMDKARLEQCAKYLMVGGGTRGGPVLHRGKGVRVWDINGKDYIDCTSQGWALYLGYAHDAINQVIREHIENLTHVHQPFDTKVRYSYGRERSPFNIFTAFSRTIPRSSGTTRLKESLPSSSSWL